MSLLEVRNLRKSFGDHTVVKDISFDVEAGEVFGLLGPNGAGKSTTMNMLCGLLDKDSGSIKLDGQEVGSKNRSSRTILGFVPQDLAIYPDLTARENLTFFGQLYGITGAKLDKQIHFVLDNVGLLDRANDNTGDFSGGMKRRLNFAVALLHEPKLLVLDEPTVGVDPQSREHLLSCVQQLNEKGMGVIYCSHYMEEVERLSHRVAIMDQGVMLACDSIPGLLSLLRSEIRLFTDPLPENISKDLQDLAEIEQPSEQTGDSKKDDTDVLVVSQNGHINERELGKSVCKVVTILSQRGINLRSIESNEPNLEQLFLQLTGNRLRD